MELKKYRINKGFSQKELAEKINITAQALSNYELGTRKPKHDVLNTMCEVLKLNKTDELNLRRSFGRKE